ncbi:MAG: Preprotein translocase subunit SecB [Solirubrobacterales bacterium]|nr:Preprotein translocase subunit SecB [Solirubrobacterales bacterium]
MADIRFKNVVLLSCDFETWPNREEGETGVEAVPEPDTEYPDDNFLQYTATTERTEDSVFLMLLAVRLDDRKLPFLLRASFGCEFEIRDDGLTPERAEPTLVFMAYPYVREFIFNLTGRSPLPAYSLPPITRSPDPSPQSDTAR